LIHLKNYETLFIKEFVDPDVDMSGLKSKIVEAYPVNYIP
jgi:hypothetical protein